jgi:hypothetical protein
MLNLSWVDKADTTLLEGLCHLLIDCTNGGRSVGFLAPLQAQTARRYREEVFAPLGPGQVLWVAEGSSWTTLLHF